LPLCNANDFENSNTAGKPLPTLQPLITSGKKPYFEFRVGAPQLHGSTPARPRAMDSKTYHVLILK
jgi:hypothetical protein